jgi:predicted RND superfamily exporter protein
MIGYGSLLVSDNLAIRSFGVVSLLGEACTVMAALIVVPAILMIGWRGPAAATVTNEARAA